MLRPDPSTKSWLCALASFLLGTPLLGTLLLGTLLSTAAPAQFRTTDENKSLFSIPRSQDDIHALKMARADLVDGRFASAVERLHQLLERDRHGLLPTTTGMYLGMRTAVIRTLRKLTEAGQQAYEKLATREAGDLLRTAFVGRNLQGLRQLAERFPTATAGRRARLRLGDLHLEAGFAAGAISEYNSLLESLAQTSKQRPLAEQRLQFAKALQRSQNGHGNGEHEDADALAASNTATAGWPAYGGGGDATTPMTFPAQLGPKHLRLQLSSPGYGSFHQLTAHATGGLGGLFFNTGQEVICFDPLSGGVRWKARGAMSDAYHDDYQNTLNRSMLLSVALSPNVVVAALQVPNSTRASSFHQLALLYKLPTRRLFAFDRHTGKRLWSHFDSQGGPLARRFAAHNAPAPPIIVGDTVYVPTEHYTGAVSYYLSAYDLHTGDERWRTLICSSQLEVNMFGNAKLEYAATPVAIHEGTLYGTTNLGLNFAADAITGRVKWCSTYPVIPLPRTRLRGQNIRPVFFANNPILVHDGVMISTPLDSAAIVAMRIRDGRILWQLPHLNQAGHRNQLVWTLGLLGDEVILSGLGVVGVKTQPDGNGRPQVRQIRPPQYLNRGISSRVARGSVTRRYITHPGVKGLQAFDAEGNAAPRQFGITNPGNLLMVDGLLVSARANEVHIYLDREFLLDQARRAIQREPDNPSHYLRLASLMRTGGLGTDLMGLRGSKTLSLLRRGLDAARRAGLGKASPVHQSLASELFRISLLRADHTAKVGSRDRALKQYRRARDEAPNPKQWITAQLRILRSIDQAPGKILVELDLLADNQADEIYRFEKFGKLPVQAYAAWQSIPHLQDPAAVIERCQELLERFPDVPLWRETAQRFATRTIAEVLIKSGRSAYAKIEVRAEQALAGAGENLDRLREVDRRFPHSLAAHKARRQVLDRAAQAGDLTTAAAMASRNASGLTPSLMRRLMVAADVAQNHPLAAALGRRLQAQHGSVISDYGPDGDKTMAEVVRIPDLPAAPVFELQLPVKQLGASIHKSGASAIEVLDTRVVAGFPSSDNRPLYVTAGRDRLQAFDLTNPERTAMFSVQSNLTRHLTRTAEPLHLCGIYLIVNETQQVRARHYRTGKEQWRKTAGEDRVLRVLDIQHGVVQLFSSLHNDGDGGQLFGLDVISGAQLFSHTFPSTRETLVPRAFLGDLWTLHNPEGSSRVELQRFDGITGQLRHTFSIPNNTLSKLLPKSRISRNMSLARLQDTLMVDANAIYLSTSDRGGVMSPFLVAMQHSGRLKWTWKSRSQRGYLKMRAMHPAGIVAIEAVPGSRISTRLTLLDHKSGLETRGLRMQGSVRILHQHMQPFAPDYLFMEEGQTNSLIGFSLDGKRPSFRHPSNKRDVFWRYPVLGPDFFAAPVISANGRRLDLLTLRLRDRRGALPGGRKNLELATKMASSGGTRILVHDRYTICQTATGIQVLGSKEPDKR